MDVLFVYEIRYERILERFKELLKLFPKERYNPFNLWVYFTARESVYNSRKRYIRFHEDIAI